MSLKCTGNALSGLKRPDQALDQVGGGVMRSLHGNASVSVASLRKGVSRRWEKWRHFSRTTDSLVRLM